VRAPSTENHWYKWIMIATAVVLSAKLWKAVVARFHEGRTVMGINFSMSLANIKKSIDVFLFTGNKLIKTSVLLKVSIYNFKTKRRLESHTAVIGKLSLWWTKKPFPIPAVCRKLTYSILYKFIWNSLLISFSFNLARKIEWLNFGCLYTTPTAYSSLSVNTAL